MAAAVYSFEHLAPSVLEVRHCSVWAGVGLAAAEHLLAARQTSRPQPDNHKIIKAAPSLIKVTLADARRQGQPCGVLE